jgi:UDP-N-acetylmuramate: L-alanyl-gamma-D-glutamyl-meso-diaminopimelate ligase
MVAWILEAAGLDPGFLIGGVPLNFNMSAREGSDCFVVEADEYDTSFFDKRAKFVHYRPQISIMNNLEYDHADIYPDVQSIQTQFHHLVRTIPGTGTIISNASDSNLEDVLSRGCWSRLERFSLDADSDWQVSMLKPDGSVLEFFHLGAGVGSVEWEHSGRHNAQNACAALAACVVAGVDPKTAVAALASFRGVKRRLEVVTRAHDVCVYDDFAHHPTAIRLTLEGLRRKVGNARILVALEPRSNTMRAGVHADELGPALIAGDFVWVKITDDIDWDPLAVLSPLEGRGRAVTRTDDLLEQLLDKVQPGDHVVFMSNGGFDACPARFGAAITDLEDL